MKRLEELCISPAPWHVGTKGEGWFYGTITCETKDGKKTVAQSNYHFDCHKADDKLIAASPELYDALFNICFGESKTVNCAKCGGNDHSGVEYCSKTCPHYKARAALAKASGEEIGERE